MPSSGWSVALLLLASCLAPLASAVEVDYRFPSTSPVPPAPPTPGLPPSPPVPPCTFTGFVLDCTGGGAWATSTFPSWVVGYQGQATAWAGAAATGAGTWAGSLPAAVLTDEFQFLGPAAATSATISIDDTVVPDADVVFVVKGGAAGERWICKQSCTVPDTGFTVSIDPLDVPPNVWLGFESATPLPNLPAAVGSITVTFA